MKKIYSKPEIKTVVLEESLMNVTSPGGAPGNINLGFDPEIEEEGNAD